MNVLRYFGQTLPMFCLNWDTNSSVTNLENICKQQDCYTENSEYLKNEN